ncbi:MAG TPA: DoxX family protein [Candidatus Acidoferrales bacterium]|nr:DoxX family protein [Candidatus Acidoferrales bacterium]
MKAYDRVIPLIGRILISVIFLFSGYGKLTSFSGSAAFLASKHFPIPSAMLVGAIIVEIIGGLCLVFGFHARIAAFIMFLYLIPATLVFHNFWALQGAARSDNEIHFLKNIAIMGGLLMVSAYGPGKPSLDERASAAQPGA